jgi:predicted HTH domain antitoxin
MAVRVEMDLPEGAFSALHASPDQFVREMRLAAAVKWYETEQVSQSKAAEIAGVSRADFLDALARYGVPVFQTTCEELEDEISRG